MSRIKKSIRIGKTLKIFSGWTLFILGIFGLLLPFLQGILMVLSGLAILSTEYKWAKKLKSYIETKWKDKIKRLLLKQRIDKNSDWIWYANQLPTINHQLQGNYKGRSKSVYYHGRNWWKRDWNQFWWAIKQNFAAIDYMETKEWLWKKELYC